MADVIQAGYQHLTPLRFVDLGSGKEWAPHNIVSDEDSLRFSRGQHRHASVTVTSGVGSTQGFLLTNPANSGVFGVIAGIIITTTANATGRLVRGATLAGATPLTTYNPNELFAGQVGKLLASFATSALVGGTELSNSVRSVADRTQMLPLSFLIVPGSTLGLSFNYTAGATTDLFVTYREIPI